MTPRRWARNAQNCIFIVFFLMTLLLSVFLRLYFIFEIFQTFLMISNHPNTFPMLRIIIDSFEITLKLKVKRKNLENLDIHKWQHWHLTVATANNELFPFQCICVFGFGAYFFRSHIDGFGYCIYILSTGCWLCRIVSWLEIKRNSVSLQLLFLFNLKSTKQTSEVILSSLDSENQSNM